MGMLLLILFINLTVLLGVAVVFLHYSAITSDPKWERWCGEALIFTIVPVIIIPVAPALHVPLKPVYLMVLVWTLIILIYLIGKRNSAAREKTEMQEKGVWKCSKCHAYNPKLSLVCWKCSTAKNSK